MNVKNVIFCLMSVVGGIASPSLLAQVNFTINGMIEAVTCTPTITGSGFSGNTLTLPNIQITQLDAAGKIAAPVTITFAVSNCAVSSTLNSMWVHFTSSSGVEDGRVITSHPQVNFEFLDDATGNRIHVGGTASGGPNGNQGGSSAFTGTYPARNASRAYRVRYFAKTVVTQVGAVSANATYTVRYF